VEGSLREKKSSGVDITWYGNVICIASVMILYGLKGTRFDSGIVSPNTFFHCSFLLIITSRYKIKLSNPENSLARNTLWVHLYITVQQLLYNVIVTLRCCNLLQSSTHFHTSGFAAHFITWNMLSCCNVK